MAAAAADPTFPQTLVAFARFAGVDPGALSRIENGRRTSATTEWLHRIASALEVPVAAIAYLADDEVA